MFLAKHLMLDWRLGERYFMQQLVDGDLGSNNGGKSVSYPVGMAAESVYRLAVVCFVWERSSALLVTSSTHVHGLNMSADFRIFNPTLQSEKSDVTGAYIKHYVPELRGLSGKGMSFGAIVC